ncbi:MAG: metallopeptidase family protein [Deferrisomatales bacterium]|nr:metallopeptidase family protein [Deferrisomatales bacterium]
MDRRRFEQLAEEAFDALPEELLGHVDNVVFVVEDWPDAETLAEMGIESPSDLLGLYQGISLAERSVTAGGSLPDRILLYQRPIEHWARVDGLDVYDVIYDTLLHEIGHHFGLDEEDLARLEGWEPEQG